MIMKPHPHQIQTLKQLGKQDKQLMILPSGSGKTRTLAFDVNKKRPATFLYVVHRNFLVTQTIREFKEVCGSWLKDEDIGVINKNQKDFDKPYMFGSIISLAQHVSKLPPNIEYVAIDEYHHIAAPVYQRVLNHIKPKYMVGMTATPYRLDDKDVYKYVNNNVAVSIDLFDGIDKGFLAPFHYLGLHDNIDYTQIKHNGYNYNIGDLDRHLIIAKRDQAVLSKYQELIAPESRKTIGFCNSIDHVRRATKLFREAGGIKAEGITHKESWDVRDEVIQRFRAGLIDVLFTRDLFNEGIDFPECSGVMFLRPTISKTVFMQQLGRGLRKSEGKTNVLVLDFIGNYYRAFDKRQWFSQFNQKVLEHHTGALTKPLYYHDPNKPVVMFDSKVISMFDMMNLVQKRGKLPQYPVHMFPDLIDRLQKKLGRLYVSSKNWSIEYGALGRDHIKELGGFKKFKDKYGIPHTIEKKCLHCGATFYAKRDHVTPLDQKGTTGVQRYCSVKCYSLYRDVKFQRPKRSQIREQKAKTLTTTCIICGKEFFPYNTTKRISGMQRRFCSVECKREERRERGRAYWRKTHRLGKTTRTDS